MWFMVYVFDIGVDMVVWMIGFVVDFFVVMQNSFVSVYIDDNVVVFFVFN